MRHELAQRGEGRAGCIFWVVVLLVATLIGFKVVPVKYRNSEIADFIYEQSKFAQQTSAERMRKEILRKARDLNLPLDPKKLVIKKNVGRIQISLEYDEVLEFPGYTYVWHFEESVDEPVFIW